MRATGETDKPTRRKQFRVGAWLVTPDLDELQRGDERVRLEPKAMEILVLLANRPGEPVSRDELLSGVWPGVLVGDDSLTQAVTKLRKALGDDPRSPSYIETISKRGYRLVAPVEAPHGVSAEQVSPGTWISQSWRAVVAGALLTSVILVGYVLWATSEKSGPPVLDADLFDKSSAGIIRSTLPTVAVLTFDPLADHSEHAYLARGIVADLATDLSRLAGMRVIGVPNVADETPSAAAPYSGARDPWFLAPA